MKCFWKNKNPETNFIDNINYKLSYAYKVEKGNKTNTLYSIKNLNIYQIKEYIYKNYYVEPIYNNYYVKSSRVKIINRDKLLKDLVVFKAYKEDLEISIKNDNLFIVFITISLNMLSIIVDVGTKLKNLNKENLVDIFFVIGYFLVVLSIWMIITKGKKSDSSRLKVVNYGIHTLESIKEEKDRKEA